MSTKKQAVKTTAKAVKPAAKVAAKATAVKVEPKVVVARPEARKPELKAVPKDHFAPAHTHGAEPPPQGARDRDRLRHLGRQQYARIEVLPRVA